MSLFEDRVLQIMELREQGKSYASIAKALKLKKTQVREYERNLKKSMEEILGEGASTLGEVAKELKFSRTVTGMAMEYFGLEFNEKLDEQESITLGEAIEGAAERMVESRITGAERVREYYRAGERSTLRIAELTGLAPGTVYNFSQILRLGLPTPYSEFRARTIEEAIRKGGSIKDICARADTTPLGLKSYFARPRRHIKISLPEYLRKELDEALFEKCRLRVQKKEERLAKIKELAAQGKTQREIAGEIGLSLIYVSQLFSEAIPHFRAKKREEKLTKIRELAAQGKTQREIAGEIGLSQSYVSQLMKMGTINFSDQRGNYRAVIKVTKTRKMTRKERAEIIRESLAQGERSLEELVKKAVCGLGTLPRLCQQYGISLPDDIIPYRYRPELDKLVDEGLVLEKIAQRYTAETGRKISRQAVDLYLTCSGQKAHWKKKQQQEREKMETLSETEEQQRRKVILQSLELHLTQLAQKEGWACQKAVEYMRSGKRSWKPERFNTILALFQAYETARQQGKKLSIFTLAEKIGTSYTDVSRVLIDASLPTMCHEIFRSSRAVVREKKKRVYEVLESGLPASFVDLEYFTAVSQASLLQYNLKRGLRKKYGKWIKRSGKSGSADSWDLNYRHASRIYEARDAGFSDAEVLEYAEATERMREYALKHEKEIAPVITQALQMLFPEEKLQKPYRTSKKSLDEVLLESHDPVYLAYHHLSWNAPTVAYFAGLDKVVVSHRYQRLAGERKESGKKNFGKMNVLTLHLASRIYQLQDKGKGEAQITGKLEKSPELVQYALKHRKEYQKEIIKGLRVMFPAERIDKPYRQ